MAVVPLIARLHTQLSAGSGARAHRPLRVRWGRGAHIPTDLVVNCQAIDNAEVIFSLI